MKASLKRAWIAKLRSGEIKQAIGQLETLDGRMCCLGVLCSIVIPERRAKYHSDGKVGYGYENIDEYSIGSECVEGLTLPEDMQDSFNNNGSWVLEGLQARYGRNSDDYKAMLADDLLADDYTTTLADLNDSGLSFDQIADVIEYFVEEEPD